MICVYDACCGTSYPIVVGFETVTAYIPCHLYTGEDHHCHDSAGAVLIMQRKIISLDLNEKLACVILGTMFNPFNRFGNEKH